MKRRRTYWIWMFILGTATQICGQTGITGTITDQSGAPILGANIYIEGTFDGTSSNQEGHFSFNTTSKDTVLLVASYMGCETFEEQLILDGTSIEVHVLLNESSTYLGEIVISAGSFEAGTDSKSEVLKPLDIVTTAGVTADIAGALNTLPGTQTVGEEGRLFVRGGDGYETTTFIDGMLVLDSYEQRAPNLPTRGRFSPFMFSGTSFSTGGYSAEYGQGLSSALILKTRDVSPQTRTDLSIMSVGLEAAHSQVNKNASFSAKIGYTDLDPYYALINQEIDWIDPPTTIDGNLAYRQNIGKDGLLKVYGKFNFSGMALILDRYQLGESAIPMNLSNDYVYLNATYKDFLSDKWVVRTGSSYSLSKEDIFPDSEETHYRTEGIHFKCVAEYQHNDKAFIRFGAEMINTDHVEDFFDFNTDFSNRFDYDQVLLGSFAESEIHLTHSLLTRVGVRSEYNTLNASFSIDPRISVAYRLGQHSQLSAATGRFRQSPTDDVLRVANHLDSEKALHYIVNYQFMKSNQTFRIEAFWKEYQELATFDPARSYDPLVYTNAGSGYARGFDLFYRDGNSIKNGDFWVSYSYLDTERLYRDYPSLAKPTFTSKHNLSLVYKHFIPEIRSQIGFTHTLTSGRPYNDPNEIEFNNSTTPVYSNLSFNMSYLPTSNVIVYLSLTNIFGRDNIFSYEYRNERNDDGIYEGRPVTLPAPRFLFLGTFITFSKEATLNQLPQL